MELKDAYVNSILDSYRDISAEDVEDALFYLSRIGAVKIEGGFMVIYNTMTIERLEMDNKRQYKIADYERLGKFYENKIQQIPNIIIGKINAFDKSFKKSLHNINELAPKDFNI